MTKERPILFSGAMVRALLEGKKTQTRRVVKDFAPFDITPSETQESLELLGWRELIPRHLVPPCPYGRPGDRLWVRESFARLDDGSYLYPATYDTARRPYMKWKPSIHMPRAACRLVLEVTEVRVERLHDITADDAKAEGVPENMTYVPVPVSTTATREQMLEWAHSPPIMQDWRQGFFRLWESINGKKSLDDNPWVWVVSFKKVQP